MLDRADRGFILLWLMWWLGLCVGHWLTLLQTGTETGAHTGETVRVPRYVRLFFGLAPSSDILSLRPAIAQVVTVTMIPVSILLRRLVIIQDLTLMLVLQVAYWLLLMAIVAVLNSRRRRF